MLYKRDERIYSYCKFLLEEKFRVRIRNWPVIDWEIVVILEKKMILWGKEWIIIVVKNSQKYDRKLLNSHLKTTEKNQITIPKMFKNYLNTPK